MSARKGLRIRCDQGINPAIRTSCLNFGMWLREKMDFPVRVVVYLKKTNTVKNMTTKENVSATFFAPYDKNVEPYIKVATGDYEDLVHEYGEVDALYIIIESIAHEIIHYKQWLSDLDFNESEAEKEGEKLVDQFADSLD